MTSYDYSHHSEKDLFYVFLHGDKTPEYMTFLYDEIFDRVSKGILNYKQTMDFFVFYRREFESYHQDLPSIFESCVRALISANRLPMVISLSYDFIEDGITINPRTHEMIRVALFALEDSPQKENLCCKYLCGIEPTFTDPTFNQLLLLAANSCNTITAKILFENLLDPELEFNVPCPEHFFYYSPPQPPEKEVDYLLCQIWFCSAYLLYHRKNGFQLDFLRWTNAHDRALAKLELLHQQEGENAILIEVPNSKIIL